MLGLGIGAIAAKTATDIYGAHKAGKAAEQASQQQQQAAQEAIRYGEPLYQRALGIAEQQATQGRAGLEPFRQAGYQEMQQVGAPALTSLTAFLGLPTASGLPPMPSGGAAPGPAPNPNAGGFVNPQASVALAQALAPGGSLQKPTVMLRAPNGQQQAVPADHVEFYLQRGATRV
jgi:hypothetical protein